MIETSSSKQNKSIKETRSELVLNKGNINTGYISSKSFEYVSAAALNISEDSKKENSQSSKEPKNSIYGFDSKSVNLSELK